MRTRAAFFDSTSHQYCVHFFASWFWLLLGQQRNLQGDVHLFEGLFLKRYDAFLDLQKFLKVSHIAPSHYQSIPKLFVFLQVLDNAVGRAASVFPAVVGRPHCAQFSWPGCNHALALSCCHGTLCYGSLWYTEDSQHTGLSVRSCLQLFDANAKQSSTSVNHQT